MPKLRNIFKNIALLLAIALILFASLEIAYRVYKIRKYDHAVKNVKNPLILLLGSWDRQEYKFRPGSSFTLPDGITYEINSKGLRDREYDYWKPEGVYRILAIGDSFTFGWKEPLENTYPKILERSLNRGRNRKYEVINAGISGYNTEQEYEFLRNEGIKYNPDLVILGFTQNDAEPPNIVTRSPYLEMESAMLWFPEFVKYRMNILIAKILGKNDFFTLLVKEHSLHCWDAFTMEEYAWKKENCLRALGNIKTFLDRNRIPLLVVIFPSLEYLSGEIPAYGDRYWYKCVDETIKLFCSEKSIDFLETYPFFAGKDVKDVMQPDGHLKKRGYLIAVDAIYEHLKTRIFQITSAGRRSHSPLPGLLKRDLYRQKKYFLI